MAASATTRDVGAYGRWLKRALWTTPAAVAVLESVGADTWLAGGCAILALALKKVFGQRAELVAVRAGKFRDNQIEHVLVQVDGKYYLDGDGASGESTLVNRWRKVERIPGATVGPVSKLEIWDTGFYQGEEDVEALVKALGGGGVTMANPIYEKKLGRSEAQARATYITEVDGEPGDTSLAGYRRPDGSIVYGKPPFEAEHYDLAHRLTGKWWHELDNGLDLLRKGWIQFRMWPVVGEMNVHGLDTPAGRVTVLKLVKALQEGNPHFVFIEAFLLQPRTGGESRLKASSVGDLERKLAVREENPIYERKLGHDEAQARAEFLDHHDNDELGIVGVQIPGRGIVYGDPAEGEREHGVLYNALAGKYVEEVGYGINSRLKGGLQFRMWPSRGDINVYGVDTPAGRTAVMRLVKRLQPGNPPFTTIEVHLLHARDESGQGTWLSATSVGDLERKLQSREGNPGIVKRFAGGVLGKPHWILPFPEYIARVTAELERRGMHAKGQPLDSQTMDVLRVTYDEAVEEYRRGGPDAVDEWAKETTGKRSRNPSPMSSTYSSTIGFIRPDGTIVLGSSGQTHDDLSKQKLGLRSSRAALSAGYVRFSVYPTYNPPTAAYELLDKPGQREMAAHHLATFPQVELVLFDLYGKTKSGAAVSSSGQYTSVRGALEFLRGGGPVSGGRKGNPELPEFLWAIDQGKILFYPLHHARYEVHEDWLGSPKWKWDAKNSKLCRGRLLAYPETRELYISSYKTTSVCPMAKVKAAFQTHFSQYADYVWTSDSAKNPRCGNPIDLATILAVGVIAGAVQGVVQPYVTRHMYGEVAHAS